MDNEKTNKKYAVTLFFAAASMALEFITQVSRLSSSLFAKERGSNAYCVLLIMISAFSLICLFYFAFCLFSCGRNSYDLKRLGVLHIFPMLWAGARVIYLIYEGDSPVGNRWLALKYILLTIILIYFYLYLSRIIDLSKSEKTLEIVSYLFIGVALMYLIQTLILVAAKKTQVLNSNCALALTSLLLCPFAALFRRENITGKQNGE